MAADSAPDSAPDSLDFRVRQLLDALPEAVLLFDTDLKVHLAGGGPLADFGFDSTALEGRTLAEIVSAESFGALAGAYGAAMSGSGTDFDYMSPTLGGRFRVRVRPITDPSGQVVGALSVAADVAERHGVEFQISELRNLLPFGTATYDRHRGWTPDRAMLDLYGLDESTNRDPVEFIEDFIVAEDRDAIRRVWEGLSREGGHAVGFDFRIADARTGEIRYLHAAADVVVGADGALLTAVTTQIDITELISARARATRARTRLLRDVDIVLTRVETDILLELQLVADLTASGLGKACTVRTFSADGQTVEWAVAAHVDPARQQELEAHVLADAATVSGLPASLADAIAGLTILGRFEAVSDEVPDWADGMHYIAAPLRHGDTVHGLAVVARDERDENFDDSDSAVLQFVAGRLGALLQANSARLQAEGERVKQRRLGDALRAVVADQRELVAHLDQTEGRERMRLAEAVHDQPLQQVVAAMLRLDTLSGQPADAAGKSVEDVQALLETAVEQLRTLIATLTPPDLVDGLGPALRRLAESLFVGAHTRVLVTGPDHVSLDPHIKESVYRIMREGLINARKHARCSEVSIDLRQSVDTVTVRLSDDGIGIPSSAGFRAEPGHLGLASMRARATAVSADLVISPRPGGGTVIELAVPVYVRDGDASA